MHKKIKAGMEKLINKLSDDQSLDGSWQHPFETGISTDCYMIILLRVLKIDDEKLIKNLTERILSRQGKNGAWKLFEDEKNGNLSSTLEAYTALLYSGYYDKNEPRLQAAKRFIVQNGGISKVHMFTKFMLALTGHLPWPRFFPFPIDWILLPPHVPFSFYSFSEYGRANLLPIMILAHKKFSVIGKNSPDLSNLKIREQSDEINFTEWQRLSDIIKIEIEHYLGRSSGRKNRAVAKAEQYIFSRIEPDGTFLNYFSSTFLMIFVLLAKGYPNDHPLIKKAVDGLLNMACTIGGHVHIQYTTATVWNTALISYALQEAGLPVHHPVIQKANQYLLKKQHIYYGDWGIKNREEGPGGWGFSAFNTLHPDTDDTSYALRAIARLSAVDYRSRNAWDRGINWLLSMQNASGGWPAFEKETNSQWIKLLPLEKADFILADPPAADLTGRTLQFFRHYTRLPADHPAVRKAVRWLINNQERNGSWYGRWGICYIHGTLAALTGLTSGGISQKENTAIQKGVQWILSIQNKDGGWGESCYSDIRGKYIPLGASTLTQTAWACDALISVYSKPSQQLKKGIRFLLDHLHDHSWTENYPVGQGMAGGFYMHYHSYRYIFPLLALAHYFHKFHPQFS